MSLLMVKDLSLSYGNKVLFDAESFQVGPTERLGLVGANGTGKSTLMKILAGQVRPDEGSVIYRKGSRLGYLSQELSFTHMGTLLEAVMKAVPGRETLEERLRELETSLQHATQVEEQIELSENLANLTEEFTHFEERFGRHCAERILAGLGFRAKDFDKPIHQFSGGWKMRAALASLLLQGPDLLMLDEPTNHLDLPTLTWLDSFLQRSRKALLLISHDRAFLNRHIERVLALEIEGLRSYVGNYDTYRRLRAEEVELLQSRADKLLAKRAETEAFIERFRAKASKARQVQSRVKMLEKQEEISVLSERAKVKFEFPEVTRSGLEVAALRKVRHAFGPTLVYNHVNVTLLRGQRVAVVGANGAGKTTLLKMMAKELTPDAGEAWHGHQVLAGYYAQHHSDTLNPQASILEEVSSHAPQMPPSAVRNMLGSFLFSGDDVDKKISVLSGGERARVALARLLVKPANLLLMDEPTNHLDLDSTEALSEALKTYSGTILFVSHNGSFLNQLATHIWVVENQEVNLFPGNLDDYWYHLNQKVRADSESEGTKLPAGGNFEKDRRRKEAEDRQKKSKLLAPLRKSIDKLEADISVLERLQKEREMHLATPELYSDFSKLRELTQQHHKGKAKLEELYLLWEAEQQKLAQAEVT